MSDLPPLPPGFQLDNQPPPLPPGFTLDSQPSSVADFFKSIPRGALSGLLGATSGPVAPESPVPFNPVEMISPAERLAAIEKNITGPLHQPQTTVGKYGSAVGEALGNPLSYVGPGSLLLKLGASILGSVGSEAGGQLAEGTPYEGAARIGGALTGGIAGVKAFAPAAEKAAIPTFQELKNAADTGYDAARASGVVFDPTKIAEWASQKEQQLTNGPKYAFTGGREGSAPKTLGLLDKLQNPPERAISTAANLDTLRRQIGEIASEVRPSDRGFVPTSDAKAAMVLKKELANYLENPPVGHVMAGNPEDFSQAIKTANANNAAKERVGTFQQKIDNAVENYQGSIAARLDNQLKSQIRPFLKQQKAQRGYTPEEIAQARQINRGTTTSNILSQLGRGGAGVIPLGMHLAAAAPAAVATGGASLPIQAAIAGGLYGARKVAETMTKRQANKLVEALAKRSPEYERRAAQVKAPDLLPNRLAIVRALLNAH